MGIKCDYCDKTLAWDIRKVPHISTRQITCWALQQGWREEKHGVCCPECKKILKNIRRFERNQEKLNLEKQAQKQQEHKANE